MLQCSHFKMLPNNLSFWEKILIAVNCELKDGITFLNATAYVVFLVILKY